MRTLENASPYTLTATNANEPASERTRRFLAEQREKWTQLPPVYAVIDNERLLIVDGNHRRDFAESEGLSLPEVVVLETDDDWNEAKKKLGTAYGKITTLDQLRRIISRRTT